MHWRKLFVLAAFFGAAPLAAQQHAPVKGTAAHARCVKPDARACPTGATRAPAKKGSGTVGGVSFPPAEYPPAEIFLFDVGRRPPKQFP